LNFNIDPDNLILKDVRGENIVPVSFVLEQNFPNPFNPKTTIVYQLGKPSNIKIIIYNVLGQKIMVLKDEFQREGNHAAEFNSSGLASGVYFYKLEAKDFNNVNLLFEDTRKMIVVK
jgi:hypothetical protein